MPKFKKFQEEHREEILNVTKVVAVTTLLGAVAFLGRKAYGSKVVGMRLVGYDTGQVLVGAQLRNGQERWSGFKDVLPVQKAA